MNNYHNSTITFSYNERVTKKIRWKSSITQEK